MKTHRRPIFLSAFTLIEILVSMAVLSLILVLLLQITDGIMGSTRIQSQRMDSAASARKALDVIAADFSSMTPGPTATVLLPTAADSKTVFSLVTQRRGPDSSTAAPTRFLGVTYSWNAEKELIRQYAAISHSELNPLDAATKASIVPPVPLAEGIIGLRLAVHTRKGTEQITSSLLTGNPPPVWLVDSVSGLALPDSPTEKWRAAVSASSHSSAGTRDELVHAMEVWLAAADTSALQILREEQISALTSALTTEPPSKWRTTIDGLAIPGHVKSSIQILNRIFPLP